MAGNAPDSHKTNWVVVADEANVIVYSRDTRRSPLRELIVLQNPDMRKKTGDKLSDRGGRAFDSIGKGRHTMTSEKPGSERQASIKFAKDIAGRINKAVHGGSCRSFVLIAAPRFLGFLRQALTTTGKATPEFTIDKDMISQNAETIEKLLAEH